MGGMNSCNDKYDDVQWGRCQTTLLREEKWDGAWVPHADDRRVYRARDKIPMHVDSERPGWVDVEGAGFHFPDEIPYENRLEVDRFDRCWFHGKCDDSNRNSCPRNDKNCKFNRKIKGKWF